VFSKALEVDNNPANEVIIERPVIDEHGLRMEWHSEIRKSNL